MEKALPEIGGVAVHVRPMLASGGARSQPFLSGHRPWSSPSMAAGAVLLRLTKRRLEGQGEKLVSPQGSGPGTRPGFLRCLRHLLLVVPFVPGEHFLSLYSVSGTVLGARDC